MSPNSNRATLIADGTRIEGRVSGSSEVLVEGVVEGSIVLDNQLVIGEGGQVLGDVSAQSVRVGGRLTGNIQANDRVELLPTGSIEGDVTAPRVAIAEGGFCKGKIEMNPRSASPTQAATAQQSLEVKPGSEGSSTSAAP